MKRILGLASAAMALLVSSAHGSIDVPSSEVSKGLTPSDIAVEPVIRDIEVPLYNFDSQTRFDVEDGIQVAGYTWNSLQTFDFSGRPYDTSGDNFD